MDAPDDDEPSEIRRGATDFGLGDDGPDAPAYDVGPSLESVVAWTVPRWLREELGWVEPYGPPPRIVWWERRSWRCWLWFVVYVIAAVSDLVLIIAAAAGR
jgi:hypothetical protein